MRKLGSSPLARRTRGILVHAGGGARLIPARAGNTSMRLLIAASPTAHPRSRGEHFTQFWNSAFRVGSSPLARGTPRSLFLLLVVIRLIPARAGNTPDAFLTVTRCAAHPRSRGEHTCVGCGSRRGCGSSPLARGTPAPCRDQDCAARLIPARAGNTAVRPGSRTGAAAHPRSRGEHYAAGDDYLGHFGSSPLARGTHLTRGRAATRLRLIPARAGNTLRQPCTTCAYPAHPRSRGEHTNLFLPLSFLLGSSPLARGTPCLLF